MLVLLAGAMAYTGFLVIGVLGDYLGTGRVLTGLLLSVLFARFPRVSNGKLRIVGLLPKPARRPLIIALLVLCLLHFLWQGDHVPAAFTGFTTVFLLAFPWLKRAVFDRMSSFFNKVTGRNPAKRTDDMVIDGDFTERKD
jgi:hypothetical protein